MVIFEVATISTARAKGNQPSDTTWLEQGQGGVLHLKGDWTVAHARRIDGLIRQVRFEPGSVRQLDLGGVTGFDTTGAWLLLRLADRLSVALPEGMSAAPHGVSELVQRVSAARGEPADPSRGGNPFVIILARLGNATLEAGREAGAMGGGIRRTGIAGQAMVKTAADTGEKVNQKAQRRQNARRHCHDGAA